MCTIHLRDDEKGVKQYVLQTFFISRDNHMVSITTSDFNNLFGISPGWLFIFPGRLFTMLKKPISSAFSFHFEVKKIFHYFLQQQRCSVNAKFLTSLLATSMN